ncbi:MAG TPA: hypothetical protein VEV20_14650, partial [Burkholderiales bacterium]|nr:hypothetical protein [Burkholderiales bacterium]
MLKALLCSLLVTLIAMGAIAGSSAYAAQAPDNGTPVPPLASQLPPKLPPLFDTLQERTFHFFWDTANPQNGLVPDRYPTPSFASIAAVGFALTAYPVGVERGYITRDQARERV